MERPKTSSRQWLVRLSVLVVLLMFVGAVSFVEYAKRHRPNARRFAVAPFDIFVTGLERWRVQLAEGLTEQLGSTPPWEVVPQAVVRERWRGQSRPEIAALDLARRTSAGLAIYGRLDPWTHADSVRVQMILVQSGSGRVEMTIDRAWARAELPRLSAALAEEVRTRMRYPTE